MALEPFPYSATLSSGDSAQETWDEITDIRSSDYARLIRETSDEGFWFEHSRGFVIAEEISAPTDSYEVGQAILDDLETEPDRFTRPAVAERWTDRDASITEWAFHGWIEVPAEG